jgi:hypothetical protein
VVYQFDTEIAKKYGLDESILLHNLVFWMLKNKANGKHFHDGRHWTYNSAKAFSELFPFWSANKIDKTLRSMETKEIIFTGNFNDNKYDRTKWYSVCEEAVFIITNGRFDSAERQNGNCQKAEPIPDSKPDKKQTKQAVVKITLGSQENVMISEEELAKLRKEFPGEIDDAVELLSLQIAEKDYKSKSHYLAIRRWVIDAVRQRRQRSVYAPKKQDSLTLSSLDLSSEGH